MTTANETGDYTPREAPGGRPAASDADDPRVAAALEEYLAAAEAGRPPDRAEFLARPPAVARELAGCLAGLELLGGAGSESAACDRPAAPATPPDAGRATLGDYHILREVGRGGMGVVYE